MDDAKDEEEEDTDDGPEHDITFVHEISQCSNFVTKNMGTTPKMHYNKIGMTPKAQKSCNTPFGRAKLT